MVPQVKKILYASDLSDNSIPALGWAMIIADQHDARITFLHVIEEVSPHATQAIRSFMGEDKWEEMTIRHRNEANSKIENRIHRFCQNVESEMKACNAAVNESVITRGNPVEVILQEAASRDCDLIIMGTHGSGLFKDAMIGSTARRVLRRSKIPVLVIPLSDEE